MTTSGSNRNPNFPRYTDGVRDREQEFEYQCICGQKLFAAKNHQYGDAIRFGGVLAACYEIVGAAMRLPSMVFHSADHGQSVREKLIDVLRDIHNYANIALLMIEDDNWLGKFDQ